MHRKHKLDVSVEVWLLRRTKNAIKVEKWEKIIKFRNEEEVPSESRKVCVSQGF